MVPTAPVRDQPVGSKSASSGMNLRFRYKLTNLRRKVISERDGNAKIVRFNESRMAKFGWLRVWQGTVFARPSAPFIWYQSLSLVFLALLSFTVTYLSSKYIYTEISWRDFDRDSLRDIWEVLDEFQVVADCAQVLTTLVSFLLGLYVTKTVDVSALFLPPPHPFRIIFSLSLFVLTFSLFLRSLLFDSVMINDVVDGLWIRFGGTSDTSCSRAC